ncbi:MAG: PadR family transcriptional regulator [Turicibacter sp.]|nr:PadR family transcriptional regulator [Turicibacter sp.]
MENLILGLLMIAQLTAYELYAHIKNNYEGIASPSLGNVQRALKKLEEKGYVTKREVMNGKVTKKIFTITMDGRTNFMKWLNRPLNFGKVNNPELGKMLMLGMLTHEQQIANLDGVIADFREAVEYLKVVESSLEQQYRNADEHGGLVHLHQLQYKEHPEFYDDLLAVVDAPDYPTLMLNINKFGHYTLQHGIAEVKFNLDWFEKLREKLITELDEDEQ